MLGSWYSKTEQGTPCIAQRYPLPFQAGLFLFATCTADVLETHGALLRRRTLLPLRDKGSLSQYVIGTCRA
jgi:hypothetical protein